MFTNGIPSDFRGGGHSFILPYTPSGQSQVYRVTKLRTGGVHYRASVGTGPVILKVVPVMGATFAGLAVDQLMTASRLPHPPLVCSGHVLKV